MTDTTGLLALLQISDSMFPSGMFTHSLGLEQLVREGLVRTPGDVEQFVSSVIEDATSRSDAVAAAQAAVHARRADLPALISLDHQLFAMKAAAELRVASTSAGRRLIEEVAPHPESAQIYEFLAEVRAGGTPGTHPIALGMVAAAFGAEPETAAAVLMQGTASAILQAAMRLLPVSHRDVQGTLHRLRPRIAEMAWRAADSRRPLESFHPLQEISAMRHEAAAVRMFAS
jgi:urease accessory protein